MIYVSEELKQAFLSAEQKNLLLTFDDGTVIDNDDIALESMGLEQTLCDSDELRFGKISSACFKTKIKASTKRYKNLWFNASISVGKHTIQLGRFKVYTDNMTSDRAYREIVAYDSLFWAVNTDVTDWYNNLTFPIKQIDFRDSLFEYLGIEQELVNLPNDDIEFSRTVEVENFTGLIVLQALCEINAAWGVINHLGKFKYARIWKNNNRSLFPSDKLYPNNELYPRNGSNDTYNYGHLYPNDDLYPSENLYPNHIYEERLTKSDYYQGTLRYEEYDTQVITKIIIREDSEDVGYSYGKDGNTYVIESNFLLYGASNKILESIAKKIYEYAKYITYTPAELKCKGSPWREVGDLLFVVADKRVLKIPILNRQLSGITALKDVYIAKGKETYGEVINSPTEQIKQLRSRTNKLTRTLDETKSEISKVETNLEDNYPTTIEMNSAITQSANEINLNVSKKIGADEVISSINQSAGVIEFKADRMITVDSPKWKVDENGSQECSDLTITGGNIDIYTSSDSAIAVEGDIYRSQIGAGGISVFRPDWNRKTEHIANGFFVYNDEGTRVTDITGDLNGIINTDGNVDIGGYLIVGGTKSRMVNTSNYRERLLYCYETPSPMFGDLGEGQIDETGKCYIFLDDIFGETIDTDCVYQVFLQPYGKGECYVTERTSSYFIVEGTENLAFGWEIKAIQRDFDTMRLEEYVEVEQEETNVLSETYGYLTTLLYNPEKEVIENE